MTAGPASGRDGVLLVIADMGSGGAQQVVSQLANHWAGQGRRVGVLTLAPASDDFFPLHEAVTRLSVGGIGQSGFTLEGLARNLGRLRALRGALKSFDGTVAVGFIAPVNVLLVLAAAGLGYRVVISERNDPARQSFGPLWDGLRRLLYRRADLVTANSRGAIETLLAYVPSPRLLYLPNPLRQPASQGKADAPREHLILTVGRLHRQKGQDVLLRAFAIAAPQLSGWRLCIAGEGEERQQLVTLAGELGIGDRVEFTGRVADPFPLYRRAGLFAFPSRWEGTPNALIEAMSCGTAPIVSDATPGLTDLVSDGENGLVVRSEDAGSLADALVKLATDAGLCERLGAEASRSVSSFAPKTALAAWDAAVWAAR